MKLLAHQPQTLPTWGWRTSPPRCRVRARGRMTYFSNHAEQGGHEADLAVQGPHHTTGQGFRWQALPEGCSAPLKPVPPWTEAGNHPRTSSPGAQGVLPPQAGPAPSGKLQDFFLEVLRNPPESRALQEGPRDPPRHANASGWRPARDQSSCNPLCSLPQWDLDLPLN